MGSRPWLVVDGAHNVASALALADTLRKHFPDVPRTLVFGTTREKDLEGQLRALLPMFETRIATQYAHNPRAVTAEETAAAAEAVDGRPMTAIRDPAEALAAARRLAGPDGLICVTGSLFLAAEARAIILDRASTPAPART
jgi:dihydrofolate synthase/folylpolyglutamate synthase